MSDQRAPPKLVEQRIRDAREFASEQARRRGNTDTSAKRHGRDAAEATFEQLKRRTT